MAFAKCHTGIDGALFSQGIGGATQFRVAPSDGRVALPVQKIEMLSVADGSYADAIRSPTILPSNMWTVRSARFA